MNIHLMIFLDKILIMAASIEKLILARDILLFLLQGLGLRINIKNSVLQYLNSIPYSVL